MVGAQRFPTLDITTDPVDRRRELPDELAAVADAYDETIGDRDREIWRWLYQIFPSFRLSCVDEACQRRLREAKLLSTMFVTVMDDVAERHGDRATFDELECLPFEHRRARPDRSGVDGDVVRFQRSLWERFRSLYDESPRAAEFDDILQFDLKQVVDAIEYSSLVNRYPTLVSERELWTHDVYNMMVFCYADVGLANAPSFDVDELALLRQVLDRTQRMGRIGNWIATWERELGEGDCSSGVVVRAAETGVVSPAKLRSIREDPAPETVESVVDAIVASDVESYFIERWEAEYREAAAFESAIESVDLGDYLDGFETALRSDIASRNAR